MLRHALLCALATLSGMTAPPLLPAVAAEQPDYVNFESHQHRPVVMSPDGSRLFVTNTPDNRVEIFSLTGDAPEPVGSVRVGLEPVAIGVRSDSEIWVVNHLSDSVSIVDVAATPPRVVRTLHVGDEPRDIVFAGPGNSRAFITAAHRGQNSPYTDPENPGELTTPGIGRADVWVFDAAATGEGPGGTPLVVLSLFGDAPGPLAASPDGKTVYAGVFKSGNRTTIVGRVLVCRSGMTRPCRKYAGGPVAPGALPPPHENAAGEPMPDAGLIVKWDGTGWRDELGRDWSNVIRLDLPDYDVFAIDAAAEMPAQQQAWSGVGTVLYAIEAHPRTGKLYVANTDARNEVRFEGSREAGDTITTVQGHLHETRVTLIDPASATVTSRHLNPHIDYDQFPVPEKVRSKSLSMPVGIRFTADGDTAYVIAKGSDKIAVVDTERLEGGTYKPSARRHIAVPGGPAGMALDERRNRLYVLTRFDNALKTVNTRRRKVIASDPLFNPEPAAVTAGRPLFYNAFETSGNGESSCASCHVAGDKDELAWDLGDPYDPSLENPSQVLGPLSGKPVFHPMKGPMLTQTMRGIANHGPLHWRGDRYDDADPLKVPGAMHKFNIAFVTLLGRAEEISHTEMQQLTDFSLNIMPPPNPIRALDDSLTPQQAAGKEFFERAPSLPGRATCASCHVVNRERGWYGTRGVLTYIIGRRLIKVPPHRNTYERVGMFGRAPSRTLRGNGDHMGPQIRGYGFTHDGGADTTIRFMSYPVFRFPEGDTQRRQVEQYLFAFESNMKPVVGQQVTIYQQADEATRKRAQLLMDRAVAGDADLVATTVINGAEHGFLLGPDTRFAPDSAALSRLGLNQLLEQSAGMPVTLTAVPPGSGRRIAIDRDRDGKLDHD